MSNTVHSTYIVFHFTIFSVKSKPNQSCCIQFHDFFRQIKCRSSCSIQFTVWKFKNFFAFRSYVESILSILEAQKTAILTILASLHLELLENTFKCEIPKNPNSKPLKLFKLQFLTFEIRKNWFHVKSEWQEND